MCGYVMRTKLNMNIFRSLFGAAILALASLPANAGLITYTDRGAWNTASKNFGSVITEAFPDPIDSDPSITFDKGIVSVGLDTNAIGSEAAYRGRVNDGTSANIAWMFPKPVFGFFGEFQKALSLTATVGNETFDDIASSEGWTGFGVLFDFPTDLTSLDPFAQVIWSLDDTAGGSLAFRIRNFDYVEEVSAVPAPAALWLFGTGLLGLIGFSRRSKAV